MYDFSRSIPSEGGTEGCGNPYAEFRAAKVSVFPRENSFNSILVCDGNRDWSMSESIKSLFELGKFYLDKKNRKFGEVSEFTHYIEVADWIANCPELKEIPLEVRCFVAFAHDFCEEIKFLTPAYIVFACWKGDKQYSNYIEKCLTLLTDPENTDEKNRLESQISNAKADPSKLVAYVRFADKFCTYMRDYVNLKKGIMSLRDTKDVSDYIEKLYKRSNVVENLIVKERYKSSFRSLQSSILKTLHQKNANVMESIVRGIEAMPIIRILSETLFGAPAMSTTFFLPQAAITRQKPYPQPHHHL